MLALEKLLDDMVKAGIGLFGGFVWNVRALSVAGGEVDLRKGDARLRTGVRPEKRQIGIKRLDLFRR